MAKKEYSFYPGCSSRKAASASNYQVSVVYYSTLMAVAYGKNVKQAGLDGQAIKATKQEDITKR